MSYEKNDSIELDMSMVGTTGSQYFRMAQQGDVALGLRFYGFNTINPLDLDLTKNTCIVFRCRIAPYVLEESVDSDSLSKVFSLKNSKKVTLDEAFPLVEREHGKKSVKRHSAFITMYVPLSINEDPHAFIEDVLTNRLRGMTNDMLQLGGEHLVASYAQVREFILRSIGDLGGKIAKLSDTKKMLKKEMPEGKFGFHLTKLQDAMDGDVAPSVDKKTVEEKADIVNIFGKKASEKKVVLSDGSAVPSPDEEDSFDEGFEKHDDEPMSGDDEPKTAG